MRFGHVGRDFCRIYCGAQTVARTCRAAFGFDSRPRTRHWRPLFALSKPSVTARFLRFGITVEPDEGPVFLELTGPPATGEFLAALLEA